VRPKGCLQLQRFQQTGVDSMSLDWRWCVLVTNPSEQSSSDQTPSAPPLQEIISSQESATEAIAKVDAFLNDLKRNKASLLQRLESVRKQNEALQDELSRQTAALQQETSARSSQETRIRQLQQQIASLERKLEATGKARQNWQAVADAHPLERAPMPRSGSATAPPCSRPSPPVPTRPGSSSRRPWPFCRRATTEPVMRPYAPLSASHC
jgi:hypothetical protein